MFFKKEPINYFIKRSTQGTLTIDMPLEIGVLEPEDNFIYHLRFNKNKFPKGGIVLGADTNILIYSDVPRLTVDDRIRSSIDVIKETNDLIIIDNDPNNTFFRFSFGLSVELPYSNEENMDNLIYLGVHGNADSGLGVSFRILPNQENFLNFIRRASVNKSKEEIQAYFFAGGAFNLLISDSINQYIKDNHVCYKDIKGNIKDLKDHVKEDLEKSLANYEKLKGLEVVSVNFDIAPLDKSVQFIEEVENRKSDFAFDELEGKSRSARKEDLEKEREFEIEKIKAERECPHCHRVSKSKKNCEYCGRPLE